MAPPVSLPTRVTSSRSSASSKSPTSRATPAGVRSASAFSGSGASPAGGRGRCGGRSLQQRRHLAPHLAVDQQAVDEHDGRALAGVAVADRSLRQRELWHVILAMLYRCVQAVRIMHTDSMNVKRPSMPSAPRPPAPRSWRPPGPFRRAGLRRRGHRGDRARGGRDARRALPPVHRQARALRRGLRAGRGRGDPAHRPRRGRLRRQRPARRAARRRPRLA